MKKKPSLPKKSPRNESRSVFCNKCKRTFTVGLLVGCPVDATIAALKLLRCARCKAHRRWLEVV